MNKYTADTTKCGCHPETCCHWDWSVYKPDGNRLNSYATKEEAQVMADTFNVRAEAEVHLAEYRLGLKKARDRTPDPKPEQPNKVEQPVDPEQADCTLSLKGEYDPRDQIIADLSIEVARLKKRLDDVSEIVHSSETSLRAALDVFAQFRGSYMY